MSKCLGRRNSLGDAFNHILRDGLGFCVRFSAPSWEHLLVLVIGAILSYVATEGVFVVQAREAAKDVAIASEDERIERLKKLVAALKQAAFGRQFERIDPDQLTLPWKTRRRLWP